MSSLPSHPARRLALQDLIDDCMFAVFADYDMFEAIETRAVAAHHDGFHRVIGLRDAQASFQVQPILEDTVAMIEPVGGRMGFAQVYLKENGREVVFLAAINDSEKGLCILELKRGTGDPLRDLLPVSSSDANYSLLERLEWGGARRKVDVEIRDETRI